MIASYRAWYRAAYAGAIGLVVALLPGMATGQSAHVGAGEYPRMARSIWWRPHADDTATLGLYTFDGDTPPTEDFDDLLSVEPVAIREMVDDERLNRAALTGNAMKVVGTLSGECRRTPNGRFGGGLRFHGKPGRLAHGVSGAPYGSRTIEFWARLEALPSSPLDIVSFQATAAAHDHMRRAGHSPLVSPALRLLPDGRLQPVWPEKTLDPIGPALAVGRWTHVAFGWGSLSLTQTGARLQLDGTTVWEMKTPLQEILVLDGFVIGSHPPDAKTWDATVDEVRWSTALRDYYEYDLDWTRADAPADAPAGPPYFRDAADLLFHAGFDKTLSPELCRPGTTFKKHEVTQADEELTPAKVETVFPKGVAGAALAVGDGSLSPEYRGESNLVTEAGTVAFWLQPLDWDNFTRDNPHDSHDPLVFGLLQVDGLYPPGSYFRQFRPYGYLLEFNLSMNPPESAPHDIPLAPGRWTHIAFCWEGAGMHHYVNGKRMNPSGFWGVDRAMHEGNVQNWPAHPDWWLNAIPQAIRFGTRMYWSPKIAVPRTALDDFRIYRRALTGPEIRNLMRLYDARAEPDPLPPAEMTIVWNGVAGRYSAALTPLTADHAKAAGVAARLVDAAGKVLAEGEAKLGAHSRGRVELASEPLDFGEFAIEGEVRDAEGKTLAAVGEPFERVPPPWWQSQAGVSDQVMPEWTPVRAEGATLSVWGREIGLGPLGLPKQIVSAGGALLESPVELRIARNGAPLGFTPETKSDPVLDGEVRADWRNVARAGDVRITVDGCIEFDGMMWYTCTLEPATGEPTTLDELTLDIAYTAPNAEMGHWFMGGPQGLRHPHVIREGGDLPAGQGMLFRSNDRETVSLAKGLVGSFIPYVMLTGMERGMAWFAENDRGWTQSTNTPAVTIRREGETVILRLNVISENITLGEPRTFAFGLHPIPVKPLDPDWRSLRGAMADTFSGNNLKGPPGSTAFHAYPIGDDWEAVRRRMDEMEDGLPALGMKRAVEGYRREAASRWGEPPPPHTLTTAGLYWDMQLQNFAAVPLSREWTEVFVGKDCLWYNRDLVDCVSWCWEQWILRTDKFVGGAYIDDCWNTAQWQEGGPVSYRLPDGHIQPGFQWRGYRERFKRMRRISLQHLDRSRVTAHTTHTYFIPYHTFFDFILDGEDRYSAPQRGQADFIDHWPLDRMRFMHHGKWGLRTTWLSFMGGGVAPPPAWEFRQQRAYAANLGLHDIAWHFPGCGFRFDEPDVEFVPYWDNGGLASHEHEDLTMSAWKRDGDCIVLLVNVGTNRLEAAVRLDPAPMGFGDRAADSLSIQDVDGTLLRYFDEDPTTVENPKMAESATVTEMKGGTDMDAFSLDERPEDLPSDERRAKDPDGTFEWKDGVLRCPVRRHDYRLFLFSVEGVTKSGGPSQ